MSSIHRRRPAAAALVDTGGSCKSGALACDTQGAAGAAVDMTATFNQPRAAVWTPIAAQTRRSGGKACDAPPPERRAARRAKHPPWVL
ncbi:hypothetical protein MNEG_14343, partial [Monoraphidium neglectum]